MPIKNIINRLKNLTEIDIQNQWLNYDQDLTNPPQFKDIKNWSKMTPNDKNYLVWEKGNKVKWLAQNIIIPTQINNYFLEKFCLRLALTWWAKEAQIFVNGELIQEGDLFDSSTRILLTNCTIPNQEIFVVLRLVSPSHDIGALMKSKCIYEVNRNIEQNLTLNDQFLSVNSNLIDAGFVANELEIIYNYLVNFEPENLPFLEDNLSIIDWHNINNKNLFHQSLLQLRNNLNNFSETIKKRNFYLLGHAHLDMAWLWEVSETYEVAKRTFNSVLNLQKTFPSLTFGHTSACLYQWIENHDSQLFLQIQNAVNNGNWELLGGMWVESDTNLISGESLIRQFLYGQKYFKSKFGFVNKIAWLTDTFGFCWQLPQILTLCEIEYFVTGKLHWNDTNPFPYSYFWWRSPNGSKILTLMSPPNVAGVMDTNPITMTNYAIDWEKQTNLPDIFWIPGVGDHGGGPTRDMLEVANLYSQSPFFPNLQFTTTQDYLHKISSDTASLPTWNDELYLELHRGCYTTHADQKYFNRLSENLLYQCELLSTIGNLLDLRILGKGTEFSTLNNHISNNTKSQAFLLENRKKIELIWKEVLFNQFHDILPGTSIEEVFITANKSWQNIINNCEQILKDSLTVISDYILLPKLPNTEAKPLIIFNTLNWQRSEIIEIEIKGKYSKIIDENNQEIITQISINNTLLFLAENIPSIGYKIYWLLPQEEVIKNQPIIDNKFTLENDYIKVVINQETGDIKSLFDKKNQQEIFKLDGNKVEFFQDQGQYWDAWNIDPNYQNYPLDSATLKSITWIEKGYLQSTIRVIKLFNKSEFIQDYILGINTPILKIKNKVNWQEDHILVKVAFPLAINSNYVTYEIGCGAIERSTNSQEKIDQAKWEVCGHNWADLSNNNYGVSILTNCKYGYDATSNQIRLSLLRSPTWPNPNADRGLHEFTYAIYPHNSSWRSAKTVQKGYELNMPLQWIFKEDKDDNLNLPKILPSEGKLLDLGADNLILMAFKFAENDQNEIILRCYECHGEKAELKIENNLNLTIKEEVNCLENYQNELQKIVNPWQILTLKAVVMEIEESHS